MDMHTSHESRGGPQGCGSACLTGIRSLKTPGPGAVAHMSLHHKTNNVKEPPDRQTRTTFPSPNSHQGSSVVRIAWRPSKSALNRAAPSGEQPSKPTPPYRQPTFCNFVKNPIGTLLFCGFYGEARMARTACPPALLSAFPAKPLDSHRESARSKGNRRSGARFPQMGVPIPRFQDGNAASYNATRPPSAWTDDGPANPIPMRGCANGHTSGASGQNSIPKSTP